MNKEEYRTLESEFMRPGALEITEPRKINTSRIDPPIPTRAFDWTATFDNYDGPGSPIGHGATEQEAIDDLEQVGEERVFDAEDIEEWQRRSEEQGAE